ncbi:MAG: HPr family phosphocarrier protein [Desulfovibrionales bacterium]
MGEGILTKEVRVLNELGMHARPAGRLAQEAQKFSSSVFLVHNGQKVDAKSILDILTLALSKGSSIRIEAQGPDADTAVERLERLFNDRFGEDR